MEEKFIELFKQILEIETDTVKLDTKFRELEEWDSLAYLSVIAMMDEEFDVVVEGNEFKKLITIADLIQAVKG